MAMRYREFSRAQLPGMGEELVADTSVLVNGKRVIHRVHSMTTSAYKDVEITGDDPVADQLAIIDARKAVMAHDQKDHGPKPAPKPQRRQLTQVEILASCPGCGGCGFTVDEWGDERVCACRQ